MKKNITMRDIAEKLNVSTVTVSKALAGREGVSEDLRTAIKELANEMGYRYNSAARDMRSGKSQNVGIIIADRYMKDDAFYLRMYQSVVKELLKNGYYGIMEVISHSVEKDLKLPNILIDNKVDGIIIIGQISTKYVDLIQTIDIPCVFLDFYDEHQEIDSILSDSVYGSYAVTNYLIMNGHEEIGFVGNIFATSSILDRYLGYYKALLMNNIHVNKDWVLKDRNDNGELIEVELPKRDMPTAFVCNCDETAYNLIKILKKNGYKVPNDISVVGFDNYLYSSLASPRITTFEVDVEAMAETAVDAIVHRLENREYSHGRKVISGKIVIRDSVKRIEKK